MTTTTANHSIAKEIGDLIRQLPEASGGVRKHLTDQVLTILFPHFRNWAPQLSRVHGDVYRNHTEDLVTVIALKMMDKLAEVTAEKPHDTVANWYSYLYGIARYGALAYFQSGAVTAASGMTTIMRRQRQAATVRAKLRSSLGREPSDQEIIESANADMLSRRSNAAKQGVLLTEADLVPVGSAADIEDHLGAAAPADDEALLAPTEARDLIRFIIEECRATSTQLGVAADTWLGSMYADPPVLGTAADVARALSIQVSKAAELLLTVSEIAQDLCRTRFGITFPGV